MTLVADAVFRDADGTEHALAPLDAALLRMVLAFVRKMKGTPDYKLLLHVHAGRITSVDVTRRYGNVDYTAGGGVYPVAD